MRVFRLLIEMVGLRTCESSRVVFVKGIAAKLLLVLAGSEN